MDPRALLPVPSCYPCGQRVKVFNGTVPCSNVTSFTDGTLAGADESPPPLPPAPHCGVWAVGASLFPAPGWSVIEVSEGWTLSQGESSPGPDGPGALPVTHPLRSDIVTSQWQWYHNECMHSHELQPSQLHQHKLWATDGALMQPLACIILVLAYYNGIVSP